MTQHYTIDIIECPNTALLLADWTSQSATIRRQLGCQFMELFAKDESIRDAHYDCVLVTHWDAPWQSRTAPGLNETALFQRDLKSERLECELITEFGEPPVSRFEEETWLVNPFEITREQVPDVLDMWDKAKDYMVEKPGFINARLFRPIRSHRHYNLVNIAQWRSRQQFMEALNHRQYDSHRERSQDYRLHPSLCRAVPQQPAPATAGMEAAS